MEQLPPKKIKSIPIHIFPYEFYSSELIEDVEKDVQRNFAHLKSIEIQNENKIDNLKTGREYSNLLKKLLKSVREGRFEIEESKRNIKQHYLELLADFIKSEIGSSFDFLIYRACRDYKGDSEDSNEIYRANWRSTKEFTEDKWKN